MSRGRRPYVTIVRCPADGWPLGATDGRRIFVGGPRPTALITQRVTLCCTRPNCGGHVTWHPSGGASEPPEPPPPEADDPVP